VRALIITGGKLEQLPDWLQPAAAGGRVGYDYLACADGGSNYARRLGLRPDLVVGDMDSVTPETLAWLRALGTTMSVFRHDQKQESDTELALLSAVRTGAREIAILGALGGRLDHELANLALLALPELVGCDVCVWDGNVAVCLLRAGKNKIQGKPGSLVSLIPFGGDARGVTTTGLQYPLHNETLLLNHSRGISNVMLAEEATVKIGDGLLLAIVDHATGPGLGQPAAK